MPPPHDSADSFSRNIGVEVAGRGAIELSPDLISLLVEARQDYDWPRGTGRIESQRKILELEAGIRTLVNLPLTLRDAHLIICKVSGWAGNNRLAHTNIANALPEHREKMATAISKLFTSRTSTEGINELCELPGISLVIASKIWRFCCPLTAAALDRHASYFFNSMPVRLQQSQRIGLTDFHREWSDGAHNKSRLAIYNNAGHSHNLVEYLTKYLPALTDIASVLNAKGNSYYCPVSRMQREWRATDVEMAAYYWWALNGAR